MELSLFVVGDTPHIFACQSGACRPTANPALSLKASLSSNVYTDPSTRATNFSSNFAGLFRVEAVRKYTNGTPFLSPIFILYK